MMIIKIDGYGHEVLLTGKKSSKQQLKQKYFQAKELAAATEDLPAQFARLHQFDLLPWDEDLEADYVIDTDTDRIYSPSH